MSKHAIALKTLTYLKKEEEYIQGLIKFFDTQLFRLQAEELNLSAKLRKERVRVQKNQERDPSEDEMVESQNLIEELNLSAMLRKERVRVQKNQERDQSEDEMVEPQNLIEELNLSAMLRKERVRVQKNQERDQSEDEMVEPQNLALSAPAPVAIPSSDLEPLFLDPDLPVDEEEDDY